MLFPHILHILGYSSILAEDAVVTFQSIVHLIVLNEQVIQLLKRMTVRLHVFTNVAGTARFLEQPVVKLAVLFGVKIKVRWWEGNFHITVDST